MSTESSAQRAGSPRCDVLVIGAGIVGAACAFELAREGLAVEIVEEASVGSGATAEGMGHLLILDDSEALFALTRYSLHLWEELSPSLPKRCEYHRSGTLWIAANAADQLALRTKAGFFAAHGIAHEELDEAALRDAEPNLRHGLAGGLRVTGDAVVYSPAVAAELVERACRDHGARLRLGRAVRRIEGATHGRPAVAVLSDGERLEADRLIDALGTRALEVLPEPLPGPGIRPRKGHLLITDRHPGFARHPMLELGYLKGAHSHAEETVAFALQPRPNGQLLLGSSRQYSSSRHHGSSRGSRTASRAIDERLLRRMVLRSLDYMPGLARLETIRAWTGFRAATDDHQPLIGPVPDDPRLWLASGHEGHGITTSLATARLVADMMLGREPEIPTAPFRPGRALRNDHPEESLEEDAEEVA